jgi:hypothetical protein
MVPASKQIKLTNKMTSKTRERRVITVILLLAAVATILYLVSINIAYPLFQNSQLADPLAELHSLFPLYYIAIGIVALLSAACFVYRIENRWIHILLLLLLAIMLWYTPNYLAGFTHRPDGPRNIGVALQIPQVLSGSTFPGYTYAVDYPTSYILDYTLINITGMEQLGYLDLFPFICLCIFTMLCYAFASKLFSPLTAFITTLLAMIGLHYIVFHPSAHADGVLLLLTALVLLWRRDTPSIILTFLAIAAVIICHPISPLLLAVFLAAMLVANSSRRWDKSQAIVVAMLAVCVGGWFIWPTLPLAPGEPGIIEEIVKWAKELQGYIFPGELQTTQLASMGTPFIYEGIYNLNRSVYILYGLLATSAVGYIFYKSYSSRQRKGLRDFFNQRGGLSQEELFMAISALALLILTALLTEKRHVLLERSLTFTILAIAGLVASIATRIYEPATRVVKRAIGPVMIAIILFLTLSFPVVTYSIDAYTSFPISEEAGLRFLASYAPLETKTLATTATGQMVLYQPNITSPVHLRSPAASRRGDIFAFRMTGYYYAAMRHDLSFEDNWFTRYQDTVNRSDEYNRIYSSPTTVIFAKRD